MWREVYEELNIQLSKEEVIWSRDLSSRHLDEKKQLVFLVTQPKKSLTRRLGDEDRAMLVSFEEFNFRSSGSSSIARTGERLCGRN